ncbi:hypothetical protein [Neogemmobacter tilapiae]|uniref:hypothetical protein n=1 Tax=Neogemmobacter tilapiae TaxID=875041 RepID=UPI00167191F7|nr:hypothetical protein [Gemmobacter tilapiae]
MNPAEFHSSLPQELSAIFQNDEHIIWVGKPRSFVLITAFDYISLAVSCFFLIVCLFVTLLSVLSLEIMALVVSLPPLVPLWFFAIYRTKTRSKYLRATTYVITNKAVYFYCSEAPVEARKISFESKDINIQGYFYPAIYFRQPDYTEHWVNGYLTWPNPNQLNGFFGLLDVETPMDHLRTLASVKNAGQRQL